VTVVDHELSIGDVAERTGLSVHTLRFYEREGLLCHRIRRESGHRRYSAADLDWIDICIKLRASGMPLATIKQFAELVGQGPGNEEQRLALLREHQRRIVAQIGELNDCLDLITWKVGVYETHLAEGTAQHVWSANTPVT
jgi:DNA-binding transcriptional MerR regulator